MLFLRPKDKEREIWDGRRLGVENAPAALGVDEAHDVARLWDELPDCCPATTRSPGASATTGMQIEDDRDLHRASSQRARCRPPARFLLDPAPLLHEMRLIKSEDELGLMRSAATLTAAAHRDLMGFVAPGRNSANEPSSITPTARTAPPARPTAISAPAAPTGIPHYVENDQPLADGDLILVDSGAEWRYYAADITRTFPVNDGSATTSAPSTRSC